MRHGGGTIPKFLFFLEGIEEKKLKEKEKERKKKRFLIWFGFHCRRCVSLIRPKISGENEKKKKIDRVNLSRISVL